MTSDCLETCRSSFSSTEPMSKLASLNDGTRQGKPIVWFFRDEGTNERLSEESLNSGLENFSSDTKSANDYRELFERYGFATYFVPVLLTHFCHREQLSQYLIRHNNDLDGIIITSRRAVEALHLALRQIDQFGTDPEKTVVQSLRSNAILFAVGPSTQQALAAKGFASVFGGECGNAEQLSRFVIQFFELQKRGIGSGYSPHATHQTVVRLLFLCGDKRRDILLQTLRTYDAMQNTSSIHLPLQTPLSFQVDEFRVYETVPSTNMAADVSELISLHGYPTWLVFFSPSGVQVCEPVLKEWFRGNKLAVPLFAAIGPTTAAAIRKYDLAGHVATARTPTCGDLLRVILGQK